MVDKNKLNGAKILFNHTTKKIAGQKTRNNPNLYHLYHYYGLTSVDIEDSPDFLVPFTLFKKKPYYILIAQYSEFLSSHIEEAIDFKVELFSDQSYALRAANYILGRVKPTQHEILKAYENFGDSQIINHEDYSFSLNCSGNITLVDNKNWSKGSKVFLRTRIEKVELI